MYGFPDTRVSTSFPLIRRMGASTSLALPDRIAVSESMHSHQPRWVFVPVRVRDPATGRVQGLWGRLRAPLTVPEWGAVCAFGKDHVTRAGNFDTGEQDAAEVVHQLAPSGSTSLFLLTLAGFTARSGFGVGLRIGWVRGDWWWRIGAV